MSSGVSILPATVSSAGWYTVATNDNAVSATFQAAFTCVVSVLSGGTQGSQTFSVSADSTGTKCSLILSYGTVGLAITQARIRTSGTSVTNLDIYVNTTTAINLQIGTTPDRMPGGYWEISWATLDDILRFPLRP